MTSQGGPQAGRAFPLSTRTQRPLGGREDTLPFRSCSLFRVWRGLEDIPRTASVVCRDELCRQAWRSPPLCCLRLWHPRRMLSAKPPGTQAASPPRSQGTTACKALCSPSLGRPGPGGVPAPRPHSAPVVKPHRKAGARRPSPCCGPSRAHLTPGTGHSGRGSQVTRGCMLTEEPFPQRPSKGPTGLRPRGGGDGWRAHLFQVASPGHLTGPSAH